MKRQMLKGKRKLEELEYAAKAMLGMFKERSGLLSSVLLRA